jgi:hypothetical protein
MLDGCGCFLIEAESQSTPDVNVLGQTIGAYECCNSGDHYKRVLGKWIREVGVDGVDGDWRGGGKRFVMLVFECGLGRSGQIPFGNEYSRGGLAVIGVKGNKDVDPNGYGLSSEHSGRKRGLLNGGE